MTHTVQRWFSFIEEMLDHLPKWLWCPEFLQHWATVSSVRFGVVSIWSLSHSKCALAILVFISPVTHDMGHLSHAYSLSVCLSWGVVSNLAQVVFLWSSQEYSLYVLDTSLPLDIILRAYSSSLGFFSLLSWLLPRLAWHLLCRPSWPEIHSSPPALILQVLELQGLEFITA